MSDDLAQDLVPLIEIAALRTGAMALGQAFDGSAVAWRGLETDAAALSKAAGWADNARAVMADLGAVTGHGPGALREHLLTIIANYPDLLAPDSSARHAQGELVAALEQARAASSSLARLAGLQPGDGPLVDGPGWESESLKLAAGWKAALHRAQPWCFWNRSAGEARTVGLNAIIDAISDGLVAPDAVEAAFLAAHARWWADVVVGADPVLSGFVAERHEDAIARFRAADARVSELAKRIVAARLRGDVPAPNAFGADPEWGTLNHEMVKRARHLPIRSCFRASPRH